MTARLTTGLSGLDAQLGGGVPGGSCVVVIGQPMNAQELLGYQFAVGARSSVYISTDRSEQQVRTGMETIGIDTTSTQILGMKAATPPKVPHGHRIVLDNISDLNHRIGWDKTLAYLETVREAAVASGDLALLLAYEGLHSGAELTRLRMWADGAMELGFDRQGFGLYPFLKVTKMRGVPDSARFLLFKETEKGLFMESTRRVF